MTASPETSLLREYLRADAPEREQVIARFWIIFACCVIPTLIAPSMGGQSAMTVVGIPIHLVFLGYQLVMLRMLRAGHYRPFVPLLNTIAESLVFTGMQIVVMYSMPGPMKVMNPGLILRGGVIVFSAIRADPRLCFAAGLLGAIESFALLILLVAQDVETGSVLAAPGMVMRAFFLFVTGVLGATVARVMVSRSERALSEIRSQDLFGKYVLGEPLGIGGMGEVYRATYCPEGGFVRPVAVKRLREDLSNDPRFQESFRREAMLCASLTHPNLVQVLDCGRYRGAFVVSMELVDGVSLRDVIRSGPLPAAAVAYLGAEVAAALDYVHTRRDADGAPLGLVHCDLNPPNVMVSRLAEVKLGDFGVARAAAPLIEPGRGTFSGKVTYGAPEQLRGEPLDGRVDLFALGLTLFEAWAGRPMFTGDDSALTRPVTLPSSARAGIPVKLERIIMSLIELHPDQRPASAREVRDALRALEGEAAPYPLGETQLLAAVEAAQAHVVEVRAAGAATTRIAETKGLTAVTVRQRVR